MTDPGGRVTPVLDIGGTHVTAALVDLASGRVSAGSTRRRSLDSTAAAGVLLDVIVDCAREVPAPAAATWGVAVPGPFDYAEGIARFEGVGKFDALNGVDIGAVLGRELPGEPSTVVFVNDAIAFGLGEWAFGAGAGHDRMVGITLGTGVGSAFLDRGAPVASGPGVPPHGRCSVCASPGARWRTPSRGGRCCASTPGSTQSPRARTFGTSPTGPAPGMPPRARC
jgi:glucokinase